MNFYVEPIQASDFDKIIGQESQSFFSELLIKHPDRKHALVKTSKGRTGKLEDGTIVAICGVVEITEYLGEAWAYFSDDILKTKLSIVKAIKKFLKEQKHIRRIQATVDVMNPKAIRFAKAVGFKAESILKSYGPDGHDHIMFTIINRSLEWEVK